MKVGHILLEHVSRPLSIDTVCQPVIPVARSRDMQSPRSLYARVGQCCSIGRDDRSCDHLKWGETATPDGPRPFPEARAVNERDIDILGRIQKRGIPFWRLGGVGRSFQCRETTRQGAMFCRVVGMVPAMDPRLWAYIVPILEL